MREGKELGEWPLLPLVVTLAVLSTMALLVVGTGAARLTDRLGVAAADEAPALPTEPAAADRVPTDIGEAAIELRGPLTPAPTDHLTVVRLSVSTCGERRSGSGVVVADGLVLTAAHVVGEADLVRLDTDTATVTGEVLGVAADGRDLALVAVDAPMAAPISLGSTSRLGEPLTIVGFPGGGARRATVGARVAVSSTVAATVRGDLIGIESPAAVGVSGGPAVDASGGLVGIVVAAETVGSTAIAVAVDDLDALLAAPFVPGTCQTTA